MSTQPEFKPPVFALRPAPIAILPDLHERLHRRRIQLLVPVVP